MHPGEGANEAIETFDWQADLLDHQRHFWEEGWQALPAPVSPTTAKLIPVITTRPGLQAADLAQTYFRRWNCQENAIRDWLIPLNLDTNYGYAKEQVVNSERAKQQVVVERRLQRQEQLAQACRVRLTRLGEQEIINSKSKLASTSRVGWNSRSRSSNSKQRVKPRNETTFL